jgi:chaperonin cofactor prefoldin
MGKKRIKELKAQIKEAKKVLAELEKKKDKQVAKAQHKVVEDLEGMIDDNSKNKEGLFELISEFASEVKKFFTKAK